MSLFSAVFPGQGSQSSGMLSELFSEFSIVRETFEQASHVLGYDAQKIALKAPAEQLNQTTITQPMLLTAGVAVWRAFGTISDKKPTVMAGHSLGEYSALVAAGALSFETALSLVDARAKAMQSAVPLGVGAMAAVIGLSDEAIVEWCKAHSTSDSVVSAVNFNAPGQVVIAGHAHAIDKAVPALKTLGAKRVLPLPVSVPSHCILMAPAAESLRPKIASADIAKPAIPVLQNIDATAHSDVSMIKQALIDQLSNPVQWVASMHQLASLDVKAIFEMGPGQVLCGLEKRIDKTVKSFALGTMAGIEQAVNWLNEENHV
jgi:[acyl-carrier-protein] S-malonyltransferase